MGILAGIGNIYFVYQFLKKLVTPFEKTKAFELGIIDDKGKILIRRRDLKTQDQKEAYTLSDTLIWNINGNNSVNDHILSGLNPGTYSVSVEDANGCTHVNYFEINAADPLLIDFNTSDYNGYGVSCIGACDGWIYLEVSGGDGDYTYEWSVNNFYGSTLEDISDLCAGIYVLLVTDDVKSYSYQFLPSTFGQTYFLRR